MVGRVAVLLTLGVVLVGLAGCGASDDPSARPTSNASRSGGPAVSDLLTVGSSPTSSVTPRPVPKFDGHGADVDAAMFGNEWPFTIETGRINCVPMVGKKLAVVFTADDRKVYALNATATKVAADFEYLPAGPIIRPGHQAGVLTLVHICAPTKLFD